MQRHQAFQPSTTESTPVCTKIRMQTCSHRRPPSTPSPSLVITSRSTSIQSQSNSRKQRSIDTHRWRNRSSMFDSTILRHHRSSFAAMYPKVPKALQYHAAKNFDPLSPLSRPNKAILPKSSTAKIISNSTALTATPISQLALFSQIRLLTLASKTGRQTRRPCSRDICRNSRQLPKPRTISSFI